MIAIVWAFIAASLVFIGFSVSASPRWSTVLKMTACISVMGAILVTGGYLTRTFTYIADEVEFQVIQKSGRTIKTVCRLYYSDISQLLSFDEAKPLLTGKRHSNYSLSLSPKNTYCMFFCCGNGEEVLFLELDDAFADHIKKLVQNNIFDL